MSCERFDDRIDLHAAGELDAETASALGRHAAECPACAARIEAARRRIATLETTLARFRAADDLVARTMARVRAEPARPEKPLIPRISHPVLRYAAMAAAAALFVMAGYGFLRGKPAARLVGGRMARVGARTASLAPGAALVKGDVVATPRGGRAVAVVDLAGGRMRAAMRPASVMRIADPRYGTVAHLARGGLVIGVRGRRGAAAVSTPLARVTALGGTVSVHVVPQPGPAGPAGRFRGLVTLRAHDGWARVQLASRRGETVALRPGQALILRSGPSRSPAMQPLPRDEVHQRLVRQREDTERRIAHFRRQWEDVSRMVRDAPREELPRLFVEGVRFQAEIIKAAAVQRDLCRRLDLLQRIDEDPQILRVVHPER